MVPGRWKSRKKHRAFQELEEGQGLSPMREGECSEMKPQKEATARPADLCTCHSSEGFLSFGFFFSLYPLTPEPSVLRVPSSLHLSQHCTLSSCILKSSLTLLPPHENTQAFILGQLATTLIVESLSLPAISSVSITLLLFQCECLFFPSLSSNLCSDPPPFCCCINTWLEPSA